ncbi:MAG: response regulator transcription factor [Bacteroidota bacterium]
MTRVALVDDHALFRQGMARMISEMEGIAIAFEAENGQELLDQLNHDVPDLILLDLEMPEMDGITALPLVREKYPSITILILSMYNDDHFIAHLMEKGANGYLLKDASLDEVEMGIRTASEAGFYFNDRVSKVMLNTLVKRNKIKPTLAFQVELTGRESDVLKLICQEKTTAEIAETLFLSPRTIEGYRNRLLEKTGARNTAGLVVFASKQGLLDAWLSEKASN